MKSLNKPKIAVARAAVAGLLTCGLLGPVGASAAPLPPTGTLVGSVTCGPAEETPAVHVVVVAEGTNFHALTDGAGRFMLAGLPAAQSFTIDALADAEASVVTSRFNVVVQAGETLDIGSMDLSICAQPVEPGPAPDQVQNDNQERG